MLGDFDGWKRVQRNRYKKVLGEYEDERMNENRDNFLLLLYQEYNMCMTKTTFEHKRIPSYSLRRAKDESMKDFITVGRYVLPAVRRAINHYDFESNVHFFWNLRIQVLECNQRHRYECQRINSAMDILHKRCDT
ncbi:hypothetical protein EVAR_70639_1 [Eumeta japonica]|uniref:Uncharacterized protein n=1 Tax=Eumeta variegata TaxID=151549 RepID=A0A4C2A7G7_EUMVA|nr:hypothetical protein EVAR_70639_1 [Eumeta japonica]